MKTKVFVTTLILAALVATAAAFFTQQRFPGFLAIGFIGCTNTSQGKPAVLFVVTNQSDSVIQFRCLAEVKSNGWPVYGPITRSNFLQMGWEIPSGCLLSNRHVGMSIPIPHTERLWRVSFLYYEPYSQYQKRERWCASLKRYHLAWLTFLIGTERKMYLQNGPEMTNALAF